MADVNVPPSVDEQGLPVCEVCGQRVRPDEPGVFSLVIGWAEARTGGGAHGISERRDLGRYRHKGCHHHGGQASIF